MANFDFKAWYKGAVAAAVALLGVGAVAHEPKVLALALGLLFLGLGEWINHPLQSTIVGPGIGMGAGILTSEARRFTLLGSIFVVAGLVMMGLAFYRFAVPLILTR